MSIPRKSARFFSVKPLLKNHICTLSEQKQDILSKFIDSGLFIEWRRCAKGKFLIGSNHPNTKIYIKSSYALRQEEARNLIHYYWIIHPFSMFNLHWDNFMFIIYSIFFIKLPITFVSRDKICQRYFSMNVLLDIFYLTNMILTVCTGFLSKKQSRVILSRRKIIYRYATSYLIFDVLSLLPELFKPIVCFFFPHVNYNFKYLNSLKIVRWNCWMVTLNQFRKYVGMSAYTHKMIQMIIIFIVIICWSSCLVFNVQLWSDMPPRNNTKLTNIMKGTVLLLNSGWDEESDPHLFIAFFEAILTICGFALHIFMIVQIYQIWTLKSNGLRVEAKTMKQFEEYVQFKQLPLRLRNRIEEYYAFRFFDRYYRESYVLESLSPKLQQEVHHYCLVTIIKKLKYFKFLPEETHSKIIPLLRCHYFLTHDVIYQEDYASQSIYFINVGTVVLYNKLGKTVAVLKDGASFGDMEVFSNEVRITTAVALSSAEIYKLNKVELMLILQDYPSTYDNLYKMAEIIRQNVEQN